MAGVGAPTYDTDRDGLIDASSVEQGAGSGLDADTVDGNEAAALGGADVYRSETSLTSQNSGGAWVTAQTLNVDTVYLLYAQVTSSSTSVAVRIRVTFTDDTTEIIVTETGNGTTSTAHLVHAEKTIKTIELQENSSILGESMDYKMEGFKGATL